MTSMDCKVHNFCPIFMKLGQNAQLTSWYLILTKFHEIWAKIADFLIKACVRFFLNQTLYFYVHYNEHKKYKRILLLSNKV